MNQVKTVTISDKGQICLPVNFRNHLNLDKGSSLILFLKDDTIIIKKTENVLNDSFSKDEKLYLLSEKALKKTWDNDKDERWNKY
ncbi:MAG: AbrB/MazE/SpoVT family DNA-binding domain-containing protein [archaeon]